MDFTQKDLDFFIENIYEPEFSSNDGGMKSPDLFTLYYLLTILKPDVIIESGIWKGISTKLIRKTVGENAIIICLDPIDILTYKDTNSNTKYYIKENFIDFEDLNLDEYKDKKILAYFDDHQNAVERLLQSNEKNIKYIFYNDNYPVNCGSHLTIQQQLNENSEKTKLIQTLIKEYKIFSNIFGNEVITV